MSYEPSDAEIMRGLLYLRKKEFPEMELEDDGERVRGSFTLPITPSAPTTAITGRVVEQHPDGRVVLEIGEETADDAASAFHDSLEERADEWEAGAPMYYSWVIIEAFLAGVEWAEKQQR